MNNSCVLVFDLGASSGRAVLAKLYDGKLTLTEVHRFPNDPVMVNGTLYWDILRLFHEIKKGIVAANSVCRFSSIGIDTWGVDFALIDEFGALISNPVHYRDMRTSCYAEVYDIISRTALYERTGIQEASINTIFQLYSMIKKDKNVFDNVCSLLLIPDLLAYFLTGERVCEYTNATTTGLLNLKTGEFDEEILSSIGIPMRIFPKVVAPGTKLGDLSQQICRELSVISVPVYNVASHDTASAICAVPSTEDDFAYISSGTWSLLGTQLDAPIASMPAMIGNFSNEGGFMKTICFLNNIMGTWLLQECRRQFNNVGKVYSFDDIENLATQQLDDEFIFDVDDKSLITPGNMPEKICELCMKKYGRTPVGVGGIAKAIYDSLATKYKEKLCDLEDVTGKKFTALHIIGGGAKNIYLNNLTAKKIDRPVIAGPIEATVIGNAIAQFIARGNIADMKSARDIVKVSFNTTVFNP